MVDFKKHLKKSKMAKKKKASAFRGKVASDVARQKTAASSYGYLTLPKGVQVYAPTPGSKEMFDVLPYTITSNNHPDKNTDIGIAEKGDLWYKRPFKSHRSIGVDNDSVVCLSSFGKKCPVCEYRKQLIKDGGDEKLIKDLKPTNRNLYYVIPRGIKKMEEEVHLFDFSQWLFQNLLNEEIEENEENEVFPALDEGLTLKVRWDEESFMKNPYASASRIDFMEREEAIDEDILDDLPSLDEVLQELSYEALYAKFHEIEEGEEAEDEDENEDENEEDEDERPNRQARSTKKTPKKKVEVEEEEEEEDLPELSWKDVSDMDITELVDVIENYEIDVDADDYDNAEDLQKDIAEALEIPVPKKKAPAKKKAPVKKKPKANECPAGGEFGADNDELEECDGCLLWDACLEAN